MRYISHSYLNLVERDRTYKRARDKRSEKEKDIYIYYPNSVILPVDNNEHQRIDDVSTDRICSSSIYWY